MTVMLVILRVRYEVTSKTSRINHVRRIIKGACVIRPDPTENAVSLCARACILEGLNILLSIDMMFIIYCVTKCVIV